MNKRDITIGILNKSKATSMCPRIGRFIKRNLTILAYHRVWTPDLSWASETQAGCPLDDNLISASPEEFEKQVKYLKTNYDCIDFSALSEILRGNLKFRGNALIITFDDGYKDNYEYAYPILKEHGVPATIFIATEFIDKRRLFWWDKVAYMVKQFQGNLFNINGYRFELKNLLGGKVGVFPKEKGRHSSSRENVIDEILMILKNLEDDERRNTIEHLAEELKVSIPQHIAETSLMTWNQIREISNNGIEIGSHTVSHPVLHKIPHKQLIYELKESKRRLEEEIGKEIIAFSYPVNDHGGEERIKNAVRDAGYSFATALTHGKNKLSSMNPYSLKRLTVESFHNFESFKAKLAFPRIIGY